MDKLVEIMGFSATLFGVVQHGESRALSILDMSSLTELHPSAELALLEASHGMSLLSGRARGRLFCW